MVVIAFDNVNDVAMDTMGREDYAVGNVAVGAVTSLCEKCCCFLCCVHLS